MPEEVVYIYFKFRLLQARINKAIGMNHVSHSICNSIILYVRKFKEMVPKKFWLASVKAAQVQATQLCNAREFDDAILLIENVSGKVTKQVTEHFIPSEKPDDSKDF